MYRGLNVFMDEGGAGGSTNTSSAATESQQGGAPDAEQTEQKVNLTQSELDDLLERERGRASKRAIKDHLAQQARDNATAQQTAEQRASAALAERESAAEAREQAANARIVHADAKGVAEALGFRADRISSVLRLADLTDISVNDSGDADTKAIRRALEPLLKEYPEWVRSEQRNLGGSANGSPDRVPESIVPQNQAMNNAIRGAFKRR